MSGLRFFYVMFLIFCSTSAQKKVDEKINRLFEIEVKKEKIKSAFLQVYSKSKKINIQLFNGVFKKGDSVSLKNPFYTASIGKMFTATAIAILKEQGKLSFNDKIEKYISKDVLKGLHIYNNVDSSKEITIAQLLQHTSGLPDYFEDKTIDGSLNVLNELISNPNKIWTPIECIQFTKDKMKPLFLPGKGYHYTDTEYVLLGLIIEKISNYHLDEFFKKFIFKPLKMNNSYMFLRSLPLEQTQKKAAFYFGETDISNFKSLSADWAGGGVVSTTKDLISFQKGLYTNALIKPETFKMMQNWTPETQGMYYGFGLRKIVLNELSSQLPNIELIGHTGSTGSFLFYCPQLDTYISGTLNQVEATKDALLLVSNVLGEIINLN